MQPEEGPFPSLCFCCLTCARVGLEFLTAKGSPSHDKNINRAPAAESSQAVGTQRTGLSLALLEMSLERKTDTDKQSLACCALGRTEWEARRASLALGDWAPRATCFRPGLDRGAQGASPSGSDACGWSAHQGHRDTRWGPPPPASLMGLGWIESFIL